MFFTNAMMFTFVKVLLLISLHNMTKEFPYHGTAYYVENLCMLVTKESLKLCTSENEKTCIVDNAKE